MSGQRRSTVKKSSSRPKRAAKVAPPRPVYDEGALRRAIDNDWGDEVVAANDNREVLSGRSGPGGS